MPVIRRIKVEILSKNDLKELENDIMKLESLAKRKKAASAKMSQVRARRGRTRSAAGPSGTIFGGIDTGDMPGARANKKSLIDRLADSRQANASKLADKTSAAPFVTKRTFTEVVSKVDKMDKGMEDLTKELKIIQALVNNPMGLMMNMLGKQNMLLKVFKVAAVAALIHTMIVEASKKLYGPGGALDIRKLFKDEAASINQLALLVDIAQGKTYYSSDMRTFSHIVSNSSTESMGQHDQLYKEINIGSDII